MSNRYFINPKKDILEQIEDIINLCSNIEPGDSLDVYDFGEYGGLNLHFRKLTEETVSITTTWQGTWVDDAICRCSDKLAFWNELKRIWNYRDFERD